jgi:hypothetical protein
MPLKEGFKKILGFKKFSGVLEYGSYGAMENPDLQGKKIPFREEF